MLDFLQPLSSYVYIGWMDIIDIIIVSYVIYKAISLVKETRAQTLLKGIVILLVIMQVSGWLQLNTINYILRNTMQVGLLALIILFQPELRRILDKVGRSNFPLFKSDEKSGDTDSFETIKSIAEAADSLSKTKTGALMVILRQTKLGEVISTGTSIDARVSPQLLENLFFPKSPLHDGAVIIDSGRVVAAGCYLPLTDDVSLSKELGTRHRAGIGISETADCVVVIVSEETGKISLALNGNLTRNLSYESLSKWLEKLLIPQSSKTIPAKKIIGKVRDSWKKDG